MKKTKFLALMSAVCMTFGAASPAMVMAASTPATNVVSEGAFDITLKVDEIQSNGDRYMKVDWSNRGYYTVQFDDDKDFSSPITKRNKDQRLVSLSTHIDENQDSVYYIRVINSNGKVSDVIKADLGGTAVEKESSSGNTQTPSGGGSSSFPSFNWGSFFK